MLNLIVQMRKIKDGKRKNNSNWRIWSTRSRIAKWLDGPGSDHQKLVDLHNQIWYDDHLTLDEIDSEN